MLKSVLFVKNIQLAIFHGHQPGRMISHVRNTVLYNVLWKDDRCVFEKNCVTCDKHESCAKP